MRDIRNRIEKNVNLVFDKIESIWESQPLQSIIGYTLVFSFLVLLFLIELQRHELLPSFFAHLIPLKHFYAISFVFTLLLVYEVLSLVFSIVHSVSSSIGKQFEILSLILLRQSFKEFVYFPEPIKWEHISQPILHIISNAVGALLIFVILGIYYRIQQHQINIKNGKEKNRFITAKKLLALLLALIFMFLGIEVLWKWLIGGEVTDFFATFYTVLIFSDILIVLISLRYCQDYYSVFRNSAFALITVLIRLALVAPEYYNVVLALLAGIFALGITIAYNAFSQYSNPVK
ncbi:hypothetical protein B6D60_05690 [candidate division KSB1 bacterium 4484_87]|nr:MAG: hypothetical protein B6D60_05690 [candidate division KSB1 bacterium 4484_87]